MDTSVLSDVSKQTPKPIQVGAPRVRAWVAGMMTSQLPPHLVAIAIGRTLRTMLIAVEWMGRGMQRQQTLTLLRIPSLPSRKPSIEPEAAGSDSSNDEEEESTPQPSSRTSTYGAGSRRSKQSKAEKKAQAEAAMNLILAERVKSMARVQAALLKCEDVVYGDYEAEKEVSDTIKNQDAQEIRDEELAALSQWFRIRTDLAKSDKDVSPCPCICILTPC
eukprot:912028-Rhodomonas_salina.6